MRRLKLLHTKLNYFLLGVLVASIIALFSSFFMPILMIVALLIYFLIIASISLRKKKRLKS